MTANGLEARRRPQDGRLLVSHQPSREERTSLYGIEALPRTAVRHAEAPRTRWGFARLHERRQRLISLASNQAHVQSDVSVMEADR